MKRTNIRRTLDHSQILVNEDLGLSSPLIVNIVRMVVREAQSQGAMAVQAT